MANESTRITGPYGSERVPVPNLPDNGALASGTSQVPQEFNRVPLNDAAMQTDPRFASAAAARQARADRLDASTLETVGAGILEWDTSRLIKRLGRPSFEDDTPIEQYDYLQNLNMNLNADQREWFLDVAKGQKSAQWAVQELQDQTLRREVLGDSPLTATVTAFADPLWLAVPPSIRVGQLTGKVGRLASGVASAGLAGSITALGEGPVTTSEIVLSMAMNGAAGFALYTPGKGLAKADQDFPDVELGASLRQKTEPELNAAPVYTGGAVPTPDNLTRPLVAPGGAPGTAVQYASGGVGGEYGAKVMTIPRGVTELGSVSELANYVPSVNRGRTTVDPTAKAVYLPAEDRVFIFKENIKPEDDLQGILLHEVGVHMNAERVLGTGRLGEVLDEIERRAVAGEQRAKAAWDSVPSDTPLHLQREEALGYYIEQNHGRIRDSIVSRVVFEGKEFLRKHGVNLKLSEADIVQLIRKAAKSEVDSFDAVFPNVWHGSPVRGIDQLDLKYAGTGEGASAFGFGHYVTSEKGTALDYRNKESVRRGINPEAGGLYRIKVRAEQDTFLDLDSTVQSAKVQAALDKLGVQIKGTGKSVYDELTKLLGSQRAASEALYANGVSGNMYATGRTRGTANPSRNYVAFNDAVLDVAARYSKPVVMNHATAAAQALKGVTKDAKSLGESVMWNMHKTLSNFSDAGKKVADLLLDNNTDLGKSSMESHRAVILDVLQQHQFEFEGQLRNAMASQGFGTFSMVNPMTSRKAYAKQRQIEREVQHEMFRREQLGNANQPITSAGVPKHITEMADALDASYKTALGELKRAGVDGADAIMERAGYLNRKWDVQQIDSAMRRLEEFGMSPKDARKAVDSLVATALRRANPRMDAKLSEQVGASIIDRALRKGKFEDSAFNGNASEAVLAEMRDVLKSGGMSNADIERALDVLRVQTDEAGKAGMLKHRMDLDYTAKISVNGQDFSIMDLIDSRVATNLDQYNKQVATQAAFARVGLTKRSEITALRSELVDSLPIGSSQAKEAVDLFDNIIAHMNGLPAGQAVNENFRLAQQFTRTVSLAMSGLWQLTEYATAMAKYGALKTLKYGVQELPGLKGMLSPDANTADALRNILADHSSASLRMRPFIARYEDGFEMDTGSAFKLSLNTAGNMVPYANGMRYVHHHQARIVANLIVDRLDQASKGNVKAQAALAKYGVDATMMPKLAAEIKANGFKIDNWADDVWDSVRPALGKMMDESVLKGRLGDLPAFAAFDQVGKFLFTYRTFVLNAHNKILAGGLARDGMSSVGLMLMYQLPLAMAAVQAKSVIQGDGVLSEKDMLKKSIGQMGGIGLFSEPFKWAMGESNAVGAPGLIAVDRGVKMTQSVLQGDPGGAANAALSMIPVANANPFFNAMLKQTN